MHAPTLLMRNPVTIGVFVFIGTLFVATLLFAAITLINRGLIADELERANIIAHEHNK